MRDKWDFQACCKTTAMGIMPHKDIDRALELALGLDIPFWPQLPNVSFYEDMYVQTSQGFPGITADLDREKLLFDSARFEEELVDYSVSMGLPDSFTISREYSAVFHRFLERDLAGRPAIRGQMTGPVSFGFRVVDQDSRPIIYDDNVRGLLFDFIQRKVNAQLRQLKQKNANAFVWLDEPGLGWVFSGLSGYDDIQARRDYQAFLEGVEGLKALHLCANVNLPYLLGMGIDLLSFDAYQIDIMPRGYAGSIAEFIRSGGVICWGIVPTDSAALEAETPETLAGRLRGYWQVIAENTGIPVSQIAGQSLLAPARCCLKNIGCVGANDDATSGKTDLTSEEQSVETAFAYLGRLSALLRDDCRG